MVEPAETKYKPKVGAARTMSIAYDQNQKGVPMEDLVKEYDLQDNLMIKEIELFDDFQPVYDPKS